MEMRSPKMQSESRRGGRRTQKKVHNLPEELIIEILLRLPVKSLLRFKCVCKSWFSLISHPHFAVSHFELVATRIDSQRLVFIAPSHPQILSIDFNASSLYDDSASVPLNLDLLITINNYYDSGALKPFLMFQNDNTHYYNVHIIGSCRGFIVLDLNDVLCVWNPSTGVHRVVYWSPIQSSTLSFKYSIFLRGFGYDPSTDDYLLLLLSYNRHYRSGLGLDRREDRLTRVEFFSLRDNVWKEIEGTNLSYYLNSFDYTDNGVGSYLNGVIHWMALSFDTTLNVIVAFNLIERSFSEVPLPHDFEDFDYKSSNLAVLGELLSFCGVWWDYSAEIWVMKEYNVQSSWTRSIVVSADNIPPGPLFPICSTKNGDIIGTYQRNGLVKFNNKGQLIEDRSYYDGHVSRATAYTESLFSLPCNIQVDD